LPAAKLRLISPVQPFQYRTELNTRTNHIASAARRSRGVWPEHAMGVTSPTSSSVPSPSSAAVNGAAASSGLSSGDFLALLVGELQNQDPLDPTSTTDFINQMGSYATFDQQQTLNTQLGTLLTSFNSLLTMNSVNYIGHTVEVTGKTTTLQNGSAVFGYSLTSAAQSVQLSVQDSSGNVVWTGSGTTNAGMNAFTWNGQNSAGTQLPDGGQYTMTVTATNAAGTSVYGFSTVSGVVSGVENSSGTTMLNVGGVPVNVSNVVAVLS
jgi:flagellar basal-body rod modification protein FlgD